MSERGIVAVSSTLRDILSESLLQPPPLLETSDDIILTSPVEAAGDRQTRLSIFLYRIHEHVLSRPEAMQIRGPLGFVLSYMIVPLGSDAARCQSILGRVLRALYLHAELQVPEAGNEVNLALLRRSPEEVSRLWSALQVPYRCALYYDVRIVRLGNEEYRESDIAATS
jgi:hypothetical protein